MSTHIITLYKLVGALGIAQSVQALAILALTFVVFHRRHQ